MAGQQQTNGRDELCWGIAILSIFAQQGVAEIKDRRRSKAEASLREKVDTLLLQQSKLVSAIGTNNAIEAKLRAEVLEHSQAVVELATADAPDLDRWKADFKNEQAAGKQKEAAARLKHEIALAERSAEAKGRVERTWKRAFQLFDSIVRTLQESVQGIAKQKDDKVFSDYAGLPTAPIGGDKFTHVASITTGTNLGWSFKVSAEGIPRGDGAEVWLRIWGSCTNRADQVLYMTMFKSSEIPGGATNLNAESHLMFTEKTHLEFSQSIELGKYQTNVLAWVRRFIAAHAIRCDERSTPK